MHFLTRIQVFLLFFLTSAAVAQSIPRAGTHFTFAIPEGADNIWIIQTPSKIELNVLSPYDGEGVLWSPKGTTIPFSFKSNKATVVRLPYDLILLKDLGKSQRGIIVRTTQPVNLTLHDELDYAGEATQIWPDDALDTNYLVPSWGLWNDVNENNRTQITVVARDNNTTVTVTPTVDCIGGERKGVPSTMTLQRGECYVLKADTSGIPRELSLFRSRVSSDKPVSVLTSSTCAYAPLEYQACNEIMDHLLPYSNTGTEFYVSTPSDIGHKCRVLFISESNSYFVFTSGSTAVAKGGRVEVALTDPTYFQTSVPVQCYLITDGYQSFFYSDPSIVTVLPATKYHDTLAWYSPRILSDSVPMAHFVSVIYPTANQNDVILDGNAVGLYSTKVAITGTPMSAVMIAIKEGEHAINSPVPVFGIAYGFLPADAYSFVIMGKGERIDIDTPDFSISSAFTDPKTCEVFSGTVSLANGFVATDDIHRFRLTLTYDPTAVELRDVDPIGFLSGLDVTIDSSTPGTINVYVLSDPAPIVGSGPILAISFYGKRAGTTTISSHMSISQLEFVHLETATSDGSETIDLAQSRYQGQVGLSVVIQDVIVGAPTLAHIILDGPVGGLYSEVRIRIAYDHDLLELVEVVDPSTKLLGWNYTSRKIDYQTDEFIFTPEPSPAALQGPGTLIRFRFHSFVSRYDTTTVRASASLVSADPCPLDIDAWQGTHLFQAFDTCSTPSIRSALRRLPIEFLDVTPNPTTGSVDAFIRHALTAGQTINVALSDLAGKKLWSTTASIPSAPEAHVLLTFPSWLSSGSYMLSLEAAGYAASRQIVLTR